eukprot:306906_1
MAISFANFSYAVMLMYLALPFAALSNHFSAGNGTVKLFSNIETVIKTLPLSGPDADLTVGQLKERIGTEIEIDPECLVFASFGLSKPDDDVLNAYPRNGDDVIPIFVHLRLMWYKDRECERFIEAFENLAPELEDPLQSGYGTVKLLYTRTNRWMNSGAVMKTLALSGTDSDLTAGQLKRRIGAKINIDPGCLVFISFGDIMLDDDVLNSCDRTEDDLIPIYVQLMRLLNYDPLECSRYNATFNNLAPGFEDPLQSGNDDQGAHVDSNDNKAHDKPVKIAPPKDGQVALIDSNDNNVQSKSVKLAPPKVAQGAHVHSNDNKVQRKPIQTAPLKVAQGAHVHSNDNKVQRKPIQTAPLKVAQGAHVHSNDNKVQRKPIQTAPLKDDQALPDYWNDGPVRVDPLQDKNPSFINLKTGLIVCILVVLAIWIYRIKFHSK